MPTSGLKSCLNGNDIESVRAEFTRYYLHDGKELKDVIEIFKARGIHASLQKWKTQINLWKIGKHNRESDMLFAHRTAKLRKEQMQKDTEFRIRGHVKTIDDIDRYFKRRKIDDFLPMPAEAVSTPEGVYYYTPDPYPLEDEDGSDGLIHQHNGDDTQQSIWSTQLSTEPEGDRANSPATTSNSQEVNHYASATGSESVSSDQRSWLMDGMADTPGFTDELDISEEIRIAIKAFYDQCLVVENGLEDIPGPMVRLHSTMRQFASTIYEGNPVVATRLLTRALQELSDALKQCHPFCLSFVMYWSSWLTIQLSSIIAKKSADVFLLATLASQRSDSPLRRITSAMIKAVDVTLLARECLRYGFQYLRDNFRERRILLSDISQDLCSLLALRKEWTTRCAYARIARSILDTDVGENRATLHSKLRNLRTFATSYLEVENFEAAYRNLEQYLELAESSPYTVINDFAEHLAIRGEVNRRAGSREVAVADLRTALDLATQVYGNDHSAVKQRMSHLRAALTGGNFIFIY